MRVLIADDEPLARERLRDLLAEQPGIELVAEAGDGREALHERVDAIGIALPRIADHGVHHPVRRERIRPRIRVVDAARAAFGRDDEVFGPVHEAERCGIEAAVFAARLARPVRRRDGLGERRLETERARRVHRPEQQLQNMDHPETMQ